MKLRGLGPVFLIVVAVVLLFLLVFGVVLVGAYNGLVSKQAAADAQWANVGVRFQQRITMIPQLVNVTAQYTQFEASLLTNLTDLRSRWLNTTRIPDQVNLSNLINLMLANWVSVYEAYPELRQSGSLTRGLFDSIESLELNIAVESIRFNDRVRAYETSRRSFPDSLVAGGFLPYEYYNPVGLPQP